MSLLASVLLFAIQNEINCSNTITTGTQLEFAFLVHRHGDRSPAKVTIPFAKDPEKVDKLTKPYGYGQLTEKGLRTSFALGKFIRRRYDGFLSRKYNQSEIFIRSTDSTRAKMTTLAAMAAVYPPERRWNPDLNWTPTPYTVLPSKYDYNLAELSCPVIRNIVRQKLQSNGTEMKEFSDIYAKLNDLGYKRVYKYPLTIGLLYDLLLTQVGIGIPLEPKIKEIFPRIAKAAAKAWHIINGDDEHLALHTGVLLKEFFDAADSIISGKQTQKMRIQSGHDVTLYPFIAATRVRPHPGLVKFGALYSLELRRVIKTGEYVVLPVFLRTPESKEHYLTVKGCGGLLCDFNKFKQITSKYLLSEAEWRKACRFQETDDVNISAVD